MDLKNYIMIDELLILAKIKRSFSIGGFDNKLFLDIEYRNNEYYCFYVSDKGGIMDFRFNNFIDLKNTLYKTIKDVYFDRRSLRLWNKDVPS